MEETPPLVRIFHQFKGTFLLCVDASLAASDSGSFDAGYAIESTCHAPDKQGAFAEIFRVLKPGALFWGQEMCLTDKFDPEDSRHQFMKDALMLGIALNDIASFSELNQALQAVGFEVIEGLDRGEAHSQSTPWYLPMERRGGTVGSLLLRTPTGRGLIGHALRVSEIFRIFPKGSGEVVRFMDDIARAFVAGGKAEIFTPLYCFLARKPL